MEEAPVKKGLYNIDALTGIAMPVHEGNDDRVLHDAKPNIAKVMPPEPEDVEPWILARDACNGAICMLANNRNVQVLATR